MAKKKTKKSQNKNKFEYSNEIAGVIIILIGIIGILGSGIVGNMVRSFSIFLVGTIYLLLLLLLVILGVFLILKKDTPNLLSSKFIGIYIIVISILVLLHMKYIEINGTSGTKIITETFHNLMLSFSSNTALSNSGGGIIGALFSYVFVTCFGAGAMIVTITLLILGIILVFNLSILAIYDKIKPSIAGMFEHDKVEDDDETIDEEENETDAKVIKGVETVNDDEIIEKPAVMVEPIKLENIDDDVPIMRTPPKINTSESDEVKDEVIKSSKQQRKRSKSQSKYW